VAIDRIVVIGGGASSPLWLSMIADSTGLPVIRGMSSEASALGAGMTAAVGAGWYGDFAAASAGMTRVAEQIDPDPSTFAAWQELSHRQASAYRGSKDGA
jgi:xylulokinase